MLVFTCSDRGLLVYSLNEKCEAKFHSRVDPECKIFKTTKDGKWLAYVNRKGVHLLEIPSLKATRSLAIERAYDIAFSPRSTYIAIATPYLCKSGEQPKPNLFIIKCETGDVVHSYVQQKQSGWEPHWFNDESHLARSFKNTIMLFEPSDFLKPSQQMNIERIATIALSPSVSKKFFASYVPPSGKGQPAFCRIFNIDQTDPVASKSFFKCDNVQFKWNRRGSDLLILAVNEVDKTNTSYYGEQALHYANVKGDSCMVQLKKKGPIYCHEWIDDSFCVIYGFMRSKTTIFNLKCDPIWDLEEGARNIAYLNPQGNILLTAGFGSLQGTVETWDIEQRKRIAQLKIPDTTYLEFANDGVHFLTATLAPRLTVNNGFKIWHYSGALKCEVASDKGNPDSFDKMWCVSLQPEQLSPKPLIVFKRVEGIAQTTPKASKKAYKPPAMRATEEAAASGAAASGNARKQNKKKSKASANSGPPSPPHIDPSIIKANDDEKKARAIKKKLSQIYVLKQRLAAGEALEPEQVAKISEEKELADELKLLKL